MPGENLIRFCDLFFFLRQTLNPGRSVTYNCWASRIQIGTRKERNKCQPAPPPSLPTLLILLLNITVNTCNTVLNLSMSNAFVPCNKYGNVQLFPFVFQADSKRTNTVLRCRSTHTASAVNPSQYWRKSKTSALTQSNISYQAAQWSIDARTQLHAALKAFPVNPAKEMATKL